MQIFKLKKYAETFERKRANSLVFYNILSQKKRETASYL